MIKNISCNVRLQCQLLHYILIFHWALLEFLRKTNIAILKMMRKKIVDLLKIFEKHVWRFLSNAWKWKDYCSFLLFQTAAVCLAKNLIRRTIANRVVGNDISLFNLRLCEFGKIWVWRSMMFRSNWSAHHFTPSEFSFYIISSRSMNQFAFDGDFPTLELLSIFKKIRIKGWDSLF